MPLTILTNEIATRPACARTILQQIGAETLARIGAKMIVDCGDGITFAFYQPKQKIVIKLAADDTYVVERVSIRTGRVASIGDWTDVYAENLAQIVLYAAGLG